MRYGCFYKILSAARGIQSLQVITSLGVVSALIGYFSKSELPKITGIGAFYFLLIIAGTWFINYVVTRIYIRKKYKIRFGERAENI